MSFASDVPVKAGISFDLIVRCRGRKSSKMPGNIRRDTLVIPWVNVA